jgi:hypothetical protein
VVVLTLEGDLVETGLAAAHPPRRLFVLALSLLEKLPVLAGEGDNRDLPGGVALQIAGYPTETSGLLS